MHAKTRVTHQIDVNLAGARVELRRIDAVICIVVLCEHRGIPNGFAYAHRMQNPLRLSGENRGERVTAGPERRAQKIIFLVPLAKPASKKTREHDFRFVDGPTV